MSGVDPELLAAQVRSALHLAFAGETGTPHTFTVGPVDGGRVLVDVYDTDKRQTCTVILEPQAARQLADAIRNAAG
jgi:hypothetical protein